jgi:hypothetical protein
MPLIAADSDDRKDRRTPLLSVGRIGSVSSRGLIRHPGPIAAAVMDTPAEAKIALGQDACDAGLMILTHEFHQPVGGGPHSNWYKRMPVCSLASEHGLSNRVHEPPPESKS